MRQSRPAFAPVPIDLAPADLAARLVRPGFAFLDSSLASAESHSILASDPDLILSGSAADWPHLAHELDQRRHDSANSGLPEGAAIGWFSFDGSYRFAFYENLLAFNHGTETWQLRGSLPPQTDPPRAHQTPRFQAEITESQFCQMVRRAQEFIAAGDIYQACLSHRFSADFLGSPWPFYGSLRHNSPAPHAAYLDLGDRTVLSASPESFLRLSGNHVVTRPIKGTRPRRADHDHDERSAYDLLTSDKEVAELVMITDLERNDLGRVCEYGSVQVTDLLRLERFEQVFHLVSTIEGQLRPDVTHLDAVAACFPGGSISGAPKARALEIIAELEPIPRGLYTGAIGYFGFNGESQFNIAIRTAVIENARASFHVGAGIVADSIPEREWQETLDKAAGILLAAERCKTHDEICT
ncbi:MAG: aminodeoxychorismate synthase component I [Chthoniobacterales bacterium]